MCFCVCCTHYIYMCVLSVLCVLGVLGVLGVLCVLCCMHVSICICTYHAARTRVEAFCSPARV